jgi:PAS domain S-box-containing protein
MSSSRNASTNPSGKWSFLIRITAGMLLLNLFVVGLVILALHQSRHQYEERAAIETKNLAQVLDQHVDGIIDKADLILTAAAEEVGHKMGQQNVAPMQLLTFLKQMASAMPELDHLSLTDASGRVICQTGTESGNPEEVAGRDYFLHLRDNPSAKLRISNPIRNRSGTWVIILARRINHRDGSFAGAAVAALSLDYFSRLFSSINVGSHGAIVLRDGELGVIARFPERGGAGSTIGQKSVSREIQDMIRAGKTSGTFITTPPIDKIKRTYSFSRVTGYPLYIVVGLASNDYLKEWRGEVVKMSVAALLFLLATLFSSVSIYRGWCGRNAMIRTLEEQEIKYRTVADYTHDWEYWVGPDGTFRYISPSCKRITGHDVAEFYADPALFGKLIHEEDRELFGAHDCKEVTGTENLAFRIVRPDGSVCWLEHTCQPIVDQTGTFLGNRCCNRDITSRKQAEQALQQTQFSVDHASVPILWIGEDGRFFYANEACSYLGYSREELLGMTSFDIDPDLTEEYAAQIVAEMEGKGALSVERRHKTKTGEIIPVEVSLFDVHMDGKMFHVAYVKDISERKATEAKIACSEHKFRAIFESARDGIFLLAANSHYVDCNPAATEMYSCSKEELLTKSPRFFSPPSQPDGRDTEQKSFDLISAALKGEPQSFEWRHRRTDGHEFDATVVLSRFELDNEPMLLAIVRDISQRKNLEKQLYHMQKMESIGLLAGGIAHDFNNMLAAIVGYGHIIKMRMQADDPNIALVDQVLFSSERAAQLTRGLLAFSRMQSIDPKPIELNETVRRIEKLIGRLIGADIEFSTHTAENPLPVFADAGQIEQVLMNLATNARDAMPEGGSLTIKVEEKCYTHFSFQGLIKPGRYALITVSDSGSGMDENTRAKIFEPFFTTKELGRGTGLGLAIVYGIIKQHNGFINVYSEPGNGTSFQIHLPLISEMLADTSAKAAAPPDRGKETILLVEDDQVVRKMTQMVLKDFGYRVIEAEDGDEAIEKFLLHEREIALLILDVILPKKNGVELYNVVKSARPDMDILFVSGHPIDMIRKKGIVDEHVEYLSKPAAPHDLLRRIREILNRKQCPGAGA